MLIHSSLYLIFHCLLFPHPQFYCVYSSYLLYILNLEIQNYKWRPFKLRIKNNLSVFYKTLLKWWKNFISSLIWTEGMSKKILRFVYYILQCLFNSKKKNYRAIFIFFVLLNLILKFIYFNLFNIFFSAYIDLFLINYKLNIAWLKCYVPLIMYLMYFHSFSALFISKFWILL